MLIINMIFALVALIIGSYTDIKTREVPDWVNHGLIYLCLGVSLIYTVVLWNYYYIASSVVGLLIGMGIAYAMYYMGQWGGGDSKLLMGLGAAFGLWINDYLFLFFVLIVFLAGALYGIVWSIILVFRNKKNFAEELKNLVYDKKIVLMRRILLATVVIGIISVFFVPLYLKLMIFSFVAFIFVMFYLWIFIKAIEKGCMVKVYPVGKLTEGDWILKDVYSGKKKLYSTKDLGVSKEQIKLLKKYKIKNVLVKEGIPFVPSFLIAFVLVLLMKNIIMGFLV